MKNTLLETAKNGIVPVRVKNEDCADTDVSCVLTAWDNAKDAVDYPVYIVPAFYFDEDKDDYARADGGSATGRDKEFHLVVVDKLRDGNKQAISTVTGRYGTLETKSVYEELQTELMSGNIKHDVMRLWVSGNGGQQRLYIRVNDMIGFGGLPDDIRMYLRLDTSVDGTKAHSIQTIIHNKTTDTTSHIKGADVKLTARHTSTVKDRSLMFIPTINEMMKNWNDVIMPTMMLMYDNKFNREVAVDLIEKIAKKSGIGERHTTKIVELYKTGGTRTNAVEDSLYKVNQVFDQYIDDELENRNELKERFKDGVANAIDAEVKKLKK